MKRVKYLMVLLVAVIALASCTTAQYAEDPEFDGALSRRVGDRVYVQDPYYGTVILQRDLVTGRYYDVTSGSRPFGYYNNYPYGGYNNRIYRGGYNNRSNSGYYNHNTTIQRPTQSTGGTREEARRRVLGN